MAKKTSTRRPTQAADRSAARKPAASKKAKRPQRGEASSGQTQRLDREILALLNRRLEVERKSLESSPNVAAKLYNPAADDELYRAIEASNPGPLPAVTARRIYQELLSAARAQVRVLRVAYLGPEFSFSHLAAIERFGQAADLAPVSTIAAVFEEVNRGHATYGIAPIENSTDGRVVDTLSMFTKLPVRICGEIQLEIHLHLLANGPRGEVNEIYSKPQALSQCREWLARNMPKARLIEVTSTSTAAQLARTKPGAAAVASAQAAVANHLQIIAEKIEDNPYNVTRFAVIGDEEPKKTGNDRTAVLLQIPHEPGALHEALNAFKKNGINLTWIESFPLHGPESGYQFFLDFEGHASQPAVQKALAELEKRAVRMELLGSYPKGKVFK
ncbi:MAG: prephenate dehydratase [Planctomycetaceae bacterium]|nr:prephenate dehydratase [Planctomycetaceae bacterium]